MTWAQWLFLAGFALVNAVVGGAVVLVVRGARRVDGGAHVGALLRRLGRLPTERSEANRWAFYAHRLTGVGVLAFLALHILDVALYAVSPHRFDEVHALYGTAGMRVFECGLLLALVYHALNGLRVVAIDAFDLGPRAAGRLLTGVVGVTVLSTAAGSVVILRPLVGGGA